MKYVLPHTALKLREMGFPQGKTKHLWHLKKGAKVSLPKHGVIAGEEHWDFIKRNRHDISAFGDAYGYNRWVSAPTVDQVERWVSVIKAERQLEEFDIEINKLMIKSLINEIAGKLGAEIVNDEYGER